MQNVAGIRRNIKNIAHNYSDAQIKVREATSNDPWGPNSTLMSEIADLTYNVVAFTEIMQLIWKRLNDHGKNWRHVYKSLVLLEYLIKTGSEKVAAQCKDNIHNIQTLKDFQYYEEVKDQGINVREKAKQLVLLLKDDERLRNERARALKAKERFAQSSGRITQFAVPSESSSTPSSPTFRMDGNWGSQERDPAAVNKEIESARPQTVGEEELQLQLALAMSREEAEQEEQRRKSDDVRLQLALSQSQHEFQASPTSSTSQPNSSHMLDLLDVNLGPTVSSEPQLDPWGMPQRPPPMSKAPSNPPWASTPPPMPSVSSPPLSDPWAPISQPQPSKPVSSIADPWKPVSPVPKPADPWSPHTDHSSPLETAASTPSDLDDFDIITNREKPLSNGNNINNNGTTSPDPFDLSELTSGLNDTKPVKKSPHSFLGENSALVNLDNLVTVTPKSNQLIGQNVGTFGTPNPFTGLPQHPIQPGTTAPNLFQQPLPARPSINQMRSQTGFEDQTTLPSPLVPTANPFLS